MIVYYVTCDYDDWRFDYRFNGMVVTSYEKWVEMVKEDVYKNRQKYYTHFMNNEYIPGENFDEWVDDHIRSDSWCAKKEVI
jgi:hypothetical protein